MSLYYLRHGLTDWNAKNVMQGRIDIPLNDEGKEEDFLMPMALPT